MKRSIALLLAVLTVLSMASGCALTTREEKKPPSYMVEAVRRSLDYAFDETWAGKHIYIRPNFYLPIGIQQVGTCPAEVISERRLRKEFEFSAVAPSMATVEAEIDDTRTIRVKITYFPLKKMDDRKASTDLASFEYEYVIVKRELVRVTEIRAGH